LELSDYRSKIYRLTFGLAAVYNVAFGVWACFWPGALFATLEDGASKLSKPWQCLGMVIGPLWIAVRPSRGPSGSGKADHCDWTGRKILGPIGMFMAVRSGEWPLRSVTLIVVQRLCLVAAIHSVSSRWQAYRPGGSGRTRRGSAHSQCSCRRWRCCSFCAAGLKLYRA